MHLYLCPYLQSQHFLVLARNIPFVPPLKEMFTCPGKKILTSRFFISYKETVICYKEEQF